jgi:hypothetical protein
MDCEDIRSVIDGGATAGGDIAIAIDDVHRDHDQERRQRLRQAATHLARVAVCDDGQEGGLQLKLESYRVGCLCKMAFRMLTELRRGGYGQREASSLRLLLALPERWQAYRAGARSTAASDLHRWQAGSGQCLIESVQIVRNQPVPLGVQLVQGLR